MAGFKLIICLYVFLCSENQNKTSVISIIVLYWNIIILVTDILIYTHLPFIGQYHFIIYPPY